MNVCCAQGSAGEALLVVLLAARARALKGRQPEDANRLVAYASDQVMREDAMEQGSSWVATRPAMIIT